jgi:hypothetical protein
METKTNVPRASPLTTLKDANPFPNPTLSDFVGISQNSISIPCDESTNCIEVFHEK